MNLAKTTIAVFLFSAVSYGKSVSVQSSVKLTLLEQTLNANSNEYFKQSKISQLENQCGSIRGQKEDSHADVSCDSADEKALCLVTASVNCLLPYKLDKVEAIASCQFNENSQEESIQCKNALFDSAMDLIKKSCQKLNSLRVNAIVVYTSQERIVSTQNEGSTRHIQFAQDYKFGCVE
jgi:hypothetical protein